MPPVVAWPVALRPLNGTARMYVIGARSDAPPSRTKKRQHHAGVCLRRWPDYFFFVAFFAGAAAGAGAGAVASAGAAGGVMPP